MAARRKNAGKGRDPAELLAPKPPPVLDCAYGCGSPAEGSLMMSFDTYEAQRSYSFSSSRSSISCHIPACRKCVRSAVTVRLAIPPQPVHDHLSYRPERCETSEETP